MRKLLITLSIIFYLSTLAFAKINPYYNIKWKNKRFHYLGKTYKKIVFPLGKKKRKTGGFRRYSAQDELKDFKVYRHGNDEIMYLKLKDDTILIIRMQNIKLIVCEDDEIIIDLK